MRPIWNSAVRIALVLCAFLLAGLLLNLPFNGLLSDPNAVTNWLQAHASELLIWRLCLYATVLRGWCWMRARLLQREPEAAVRLRRTEGAAAIALLLVELVNARFGWEVP